MLNTFIELSMALGLGMTNAMSNTGTVLLHFILNMGLHTNAEAVPIQLLYIH